MEVLKGTAVAAALKEEILQKKESLGNYTPTLAIVRVGEKPDDISYEKGATKKMESVGIEVENHIFPENISHVDFVKEFAKINEDDNVDGILMLRPLPKHINEKEIEKMIKAEKDVDGIGTANMAKIYAGEEDGFAPCTAQAVVEMLKYAKISLEGKRVTILGRSLVLGKPLAMLLMKENATVTVCHSRTKNLEETCQGGEILVVAIGKAKMVNANYISEGAVVVDVGINMDEEGKLWGDVDFDAITEKASLATPVPGGVGAVTTTVLAKHVIESALNKYSNN